MILNNSKHFLTKELPAKHCTVIVLSNLYKANKTVTMQGNVYVQCSVILKTSSL